MTRVITITGGKGGVGKTNISLNLALCLSKLGAKVCLFDADLGLANINILLGLYPEYDLEDVILNKKTIQDIIIKDINGIDIIPGSSGVEKLANLDPENVNRIIQSLAELEQYALFILDTSAGISRNVLSFCLAASEVVLIITPEPTSLTDAYALLKVLCFNGFNGIARIVVNQCKNTTLASHTYNKFKEVVDKYLTVDIVPLGIVVQDNKFPEAVKKQRPLVSIFPESSASKCIHVMASRLMSNEPEDFRQTGLKSFWTKFMALTKSPLKFKEKEDNSQPIVPERGPIDEPAAEKDPQEVGPDVAEENLSQIDSKEIKQLQDPSTESPPQLRTQDIEENRLFSARKADAGPVLEKIEIPKNLPTLPHILLKLLEACAKDDISIKDLEKIVMQDPSLCSKILRTANSAYYNLPSKINSFHQALSLLGIDTIKNIAISSAIYQVFYGLNKDSVFNLKLFWWHSLTCAVLAELLARKTAFPRPEEAFLAGLLHDIGKLVLLENFPKQYPAIIKAAGSHSPLFVEEQKHLGISHADTGFWLISRWHLQSFIADAVFYHHEPLSRITSALPLVKIIHVANALCSEIPGTKDAQFETAQKIFDFTFDDMEAILQQAKDQVNRIAQSLAIEIEPPSGIAPLLSEKDREIQAGLMRQVRDIALLQGTFQNIIDANDISTILKVVHQGIKILFDIKDVLFFLYDPQQNILIGADIENNLTQELTIQFDEGRSILVTSLKTASICNSFSRESRTELTIIDEQLIRVLGKKGIICLPMIAQEQNVGVVVLGTDEAHVSQINNHMDLLRRFAAHAALAIHAESVRESQAKVVLSERLAASTAIAKKVAHEVNNPLSIIKNYLKILEIDLSEKDISTAELKIINEEIDRVASIVDELSDFSQPKAQNLEPLDLNELLTDIIKLTGEPLSQKNIKVSFDMDPLLPVLISSKNGLKQVFINLVRNASEALKQGGNIHIATKYSAASHSAEITVADDGPGLSDIIKSRLFEPYMSTKGGRHTGLGLSVVYSTVKELRGNISCTTDKGRGTIFKIVLPISANKE